MRKLLSFNRLRSFAIMTSNNYFGREGRNIYPYIRTRVKRDQQLEKLNGRYPDERKRQWGRHLRQQRSESEKLVTD